MKLIEQQYDIFKKGKLACVAVAFLGLYAPSSYFVGGGLLKNHYSIVQRQID